MAGTEEKKPNDRVDVSKLSTKELKALQRDIQERFEADNAEKKRLAAVKENYRLHLPEAADIEYNISDISVLRSIARRLSDTSVPNPRLDEETFISFIKREISPRKVKLSTVYECPHCGHADRLRIERHYLGSSPYGRDKYGKYYLQCSHCEWEAPKRTHEEYESDVWGTFHSWLIDNGFLASGTELPGDTIENSLRQFIDDNPQRCLDSFR